MLDPALLRNQAAALAAQGQKGLLPLTQDYRGEPVLAYATTIAGTPWLMIAGAGAIVLLAVGVFIVRYGHLRFPYTQASEEATDRE